MQDVNMQDAGMSAESRSEGERSRDNRRGGNPLAVAGIPRMQMPTAGTAAGRTNRSISPSASRRSGAGGGKGDGARSKSAHGKEFGKDAANFFMKGVHANIEPYVQGVRHLWHARRELWRVAWELQLSLLRPMRTWQGASLSRQAQQQ